jgi:mRNA interferase MazF
VPGRGDIVWTTFDPAVGHEQAGTRPALVLSPSSYNSKVGLAIVCPVTSQIKGYPFEVVLPIGLAVQGAVLADHVRSLDWAGRSARPACEAPAAVVEEVLSKLATLLDD